MGEVRVCNVFYHSHETLQVCSPHPLTDNGPGACLSFVNLLEILPQRLRLRSPHPLVVNCFLMFPGCCVYLSSGGKKRSQFYFDIWNMKYLSKFKWDDLTEEIGMEFCI